MVRAVYKHCLAKTVTALFPPACGFCGAATAEELICAACRRELPWIGCACLSCANPLSARSQPIACADCQRRPPPFVRTYAPLHYRFPIDAAIKALKFRHRLDVARLLAALVSPWLCQRRAQFDALLPMPLHGLRHARRGFNQADELARQLHKDSGLPVLCGATRRRRTKAQTGLKAHARRRNVRGAFVVGEPLEVRRLLIVDDVMTTGETCRELARVLLAAGAESVSVLCIARAAQGVNV